LDPTKLKASLYQIRHGDVITLAGMLVGIIWVTCFKRTVG